MSKPRILIIEDDEAIRRGVVDALTFGNYQVFEESNGDDGMDSALKIDCEIILLDLILPGKYEGLDILREVREVRPSLPVIILTAKGEEDDRIQGLTLGADDYVVKPFSIKELMARIEAVLRRSPERPSDLHAIAIPDGEADLERREVRFANGERTDLSEREAQLLRYLANNAGRAISRDELLQRVWRINPKAIVETRTIDMHITRLREKLHDTGPKHQVLLTVRGKGYMFESTETSPPTA